MTATYLAFDVGLKKTGVATGQSITRSAKPLQLLCVKQGRHKCQEIDNLINEWKPTAIVIGKPKTQDAQLNKAINRLRFYIQSTHKLKVYDQDETLSSNAANMELSDLQATRSTREQMRDQIAACLILESFLNAQASN